MPRAALAALLLASPALAGCVGDAGPDVRMDLSVSHAVAREGDLVVLEAVVSNLGDVRVGPRIADGCPPGIVFDVQAPGGAPFRLRADDGPCLVEPGPRVLGRDDAHAARVEFNGTVWRHGVLRPATPGEWIVTATWAWRAEEGPLEGEAGAHGVFEWRAPVGPLPARLVANATNATVAPGGETTARVALLNDGDAPIYAEGGCDGPLAVEVARLDPALGLAYAIRTGPEAGPCAAKWTAVPPGGSLARNVTWNGTMYVEGAWRPAPAGEYRFAARFEDDLGRVAEALARVEVVEA